jgi:hypothetical protein
VCTCCVARLAAIAEGTRLRPGQVLFQLSTCAFLLPRRDCVRRESFNDDNFIRPYESIHGHCNKFQ